MQKLCWLKPSTLQSSSHSGLDNQLCQFAKHKEFFLAVLLWRQQGHPCHSSPRGQPGDVFQESPNPTWGQQRRGVPQTTPARYKILINLQKFPICK